MTVVIASNWDCSLPEWLRPTGILELVDGVVTSAEVGAAKPSPRVVRARARAWRGSTPGEALHVGDKVDNDIEGAAAAGVRAVLLAARRRAAAGCGGGPLTSRAARPTLTSVQHAAFDPPPPPPPERPELPEGAAPRWPAWYAGVGFLVALIATLIVVGIVAAATGATADDADPTFTIVATFLQGIDLHRHGGDVRLVHAEAASREQFGLRPHAASGRRWAGPRSGSLSFYALVGAVHA